MGHAAPLIAIACGGSGDWRDQTLSQLHGGEREAFCAALLANGTPGSLSCDGVYSVVYGADDPGALGNCVESLARVRKQDACKDASASDYFDCEEAYSMDGCLVPSDLCVNAWDCPVCESFWDCTLDTYEVVMISRR